MPEPDRPCSGPDSAIGNWESLTEFPSSMGKVSRRELAGAGIFRFDQLPSRTRAELLAIHGVGPKAIRILEEELATRGLAFND